MTNPSPLPSPPPVPEVSDRPRSELATRKLVRQAWLLIALGVLIPVVALGGAIIGGRLIHVGHRQLGLPLLAVGLTVFVVRLALFASTGFHSAF